MDYLYICNTAADSISKVHLEKFEEERIKLCNKNGKVGPHGICCWGSDLIVANSYSNTISKVDIVSGREIGSFYIGKHCNDVEVYNCEAYVTCGESNSVVIFDLAQNRIVEELPCENNPHSIAVHPKGLIAISNMESDSITLIDGENKENNKTIKVGAFPIKVQFSKDGSILYVCESNLGSDKPGSIGIISISQMKIKSRVPVGKCPVDICIDGKEGYVSNFNGGSISVLNLEADEEIKRIEIGGMPRSIIMKDRYLYIGDNYNNLLIRYDVYKSRKKAMSIGSEPTGMTLV